MNNTNIDNLLKSADWENVPSSFQEILYSMNNQMKSLFNKLNLLENQNQDVITKDYLTTFCASKVDVTDFLNTINNIDKHIKQKPSFDEIKYLSQEKISKSELNEILEDFVKKNEINNIVSSVPSNNFKEISDEFNDKINALINDIDKRFNAIPTLNDINNIPINDKINMGDIQNALANKVDKSDFINALKNKIDINFFENQLKNKLDILEFDKIIYELNNKANRDDMDKLFQLINTKIDSDIITNLQHVINKKIDAKFLDNFMNEILKHEHEINEAKFHAFDIDFDRFIESVKSQFNNINQVISKISKEKLDKVFFEEKISSKIDSSKFSSEIEKINKDYQVKFNETTLNNFQFIKNITNKISELKTEFYNKNENMTDDIKQIITEIDQLKNSINYNINEFAKEKNNNDFFKNETNNKLQILFEKINSKLDLVIFNEKSNKLQEDLQNLIRNIGSEKTSFSDVENLLKNLETNTNENLKNFVENNDKLLEGINVKILLLEKDKISNQELTEKLNKISADINNEINKKSSIIDIINLQNKLKQISDTLANKVDFNKYNENLIENKTIFDNMTNELNNKYNKDDIDFLLNEKCNTELFNSVIKEISNLIDKKLDTVEYEKYTNIQEAINNLYLTENSCGIWKWVSGKLSNNYIPLEIEYYNTMKDNYYWEENKTSLMIINKGVYNIQIVIFTNNINSEITLVVNGENLITRGYVENYSISGKGVKSGKFFLQNLTINEFLYINEKVRVSVLYNGDSRNTKGYIKVSACHYENEVDSDVKNIKHVEELIRNSQYPILNSFNSNG